MSTPDVMDAEVMPEKHGNLIIAGLRPVPESKGVTHAEVH